MANWITLPDLSGRPKHVNADLVFTVFRDGNKTVLSTVGDSCFLTTESVEDVMRVITTDDQ